MNMGEFNHLQNQIDDVKHRAIRIELGIQPKSCPCECAENGNCGKCVSDDISQKTQP